MPQFKSSLLTLIKTSSLLHIMLAQSCNKLRLIFPRGYEEKMKKKTNPWFKKPVGKEPVYWNDFKLWKLRGIIC